MKILVFLHGTVIMHKNAVGKTREEIFEQVRAQEESVRDFASYVPIGNAAKKLNKMGRARRGNSLFECLDREQKGQGR